jgi:hypothetical protein
MANSKNGAHQASQHYHCPPNPSNIPFVSMPRFVQPGGLSRQMPMRYTARCKLGLLTAVERLQHEEGLTLRWAAECFFVAHLLIVKWKKRQGAADDPFIALIRTSKNKKAAHAGPLGQLKAIKEPLLRHIFEPPAGKKTIHIHTLTNNNKRATVAVMITAMVRCSH